MRPPAPAGLIAAGMALRRSYRRSFVGTGALTVFARGVMGRTPPMYIGLGTLLLIIILLIILL
jgi:hypothetical protein